MVKSLNDIKQPIAAELAAFERHFRNSMKSNVALLDRITYYIVKRKGKQIRPMFVFLSAQICEAKAEDKTRFLAASMIELLHTATLVHDDVVDDSNERRGFFSINALWKNKIAVLVGDYLLSRGLLLALDNEQYDLLHILSRAVKAMSEGELLQMEKARRLDIDEDVYFEVIKGKTASLFSAACAAGASVSTHNKEAIQQMHLFGQNIGIAFQIKDDLFDFGNSDIGKPLGIDIKEKKMTLPLIYALKNAPKIERKSILGFIKNKNKDPKYIKKVIQFVNQSGGIEYASQIMYDYISIAFDILDTFPQSHARESMRDLVNFVIERKK